MQSATKLLTNSRSLAVSRAKHVGFVNTECSMRRTSESCASGEPQTSCSDGCLLALLRIVDVRHCSSAREQVVQQKEQFETLDGSQTFAQARLDTTCRTLKQKPTNS